MSRSIAVIVLAAGEGSRFRQVAGADRDKLLADCTGRDGAVRSVIEQVLVNLPASLDKRVLVTTEARPQAMRMAQAYGCEVVSIGTTGMGDSIAAGIAACPKADGWLIVLGDMPFILPSTLERVVAAMADDAVSVPVQAGEFGHPVGFGRSFGPALLGLSGDRGARPLFKQGRVVEVAVDDPGVLWDIDVPEALVFPRS
ncbi:MULTISPECIES: nucleotidyltransferase family protein [Pseudomonas]|uniref:Nucleotidyltransferase family protein n=1 Tax=Pseudomonas monsensis TaxID=2745509 RepID=A0ABT3YVR0_9PSED|nr:MULTISPECIES: nucleotidyltransferase family protein [Pseudomonas]PTT83514.1 molybdopterin-guanine dinucleotide biosynthesis protein MobA [Pseudomonas sp. HMWF005]RON62722.1 molybdopterin-guanine dinucleotide biosynthesis protein MobA [Pseudomonas fluorescens]MCY0109596.1 nucleotidyltransferase family protein [Pseudomonas monsensis]MDZ3829566.1 nucleotidyltransferase family protein [Pseudomonas monsensis]PTS96652.1 molybdopterin-guanine dinucleotide biosynthesis protein MobA [Pseudomonas sp.